jgi:hypothetical protein
MTHDLLSQAMPTFSSLNKVFSAKKNYKAGGMEESFFFWELKNQLLPVIKGN